MTGRDDYLQLSPRESDSPGRGKNPVHKTTLPEDNVQYRRAYPMLHHLPALRTCFWETKYGLGPTATESGKQVLPLRRKVPNLTVYY